MNEKLKEWFKVEKHERAEFIVKLIIVIIGLTVIIYTIPQLIGDIQELYK